jgi:hypothetical protein
MNCLLIQKKVIIVCRNNYENQTIPRNYVQKFQQTLNKEMSTILKQELSVGQQRSTILSA